MEFNIAAIALTTLMFSISIGFLWNRVFKITTCLEDTRKALILVNDVLLSQDKRLNMHKQGFEDLLNSIKYLSDRLDHVISHLALTEDELGGKTNE